MKKYHLLFALTVSLFSGNVLDAQQRAGYTLAEQAQLDSIKQTYLNMGIPEEWASKRAQTIFESKKKVTTRSAGRNTVPAPGSIWIDRDDTGADFSPFHAYTPEEFIKKIL